jgi:hypothetical protein
LIGLDDIPESSLELFLTVIAVFSMRKSLPDSLVLFLNADNLIEVGIFVLIGHTIKQRSAFDFLFPQLIGI